MSLAHLRRLAGIGEPSAYRDVDEAVQPIGTVHSRKDGDWVKTADGWVRVKKKDKAAIVGTKTPPKVSRSKKTAPAVVPSVPVSVPTKASVPPPLSAPGASNTPEQTKARRAAAAQKVGSAVTSALKSFDDYDKAEFDEKSGIVYAAFRSWELEKDPPDEDDEDEYSSGVDDYYNRAAEIAYSGQKHMKAVLAPHMDAIEDITVAHGDKNWFDIAIKLK